MKHLSILIRLTTAFLAIFVFVALQAQAAAPTTLHGYAVGSLAGQLSIEQGAANYTIPISVPPGTAGVQPELGFSYSSSGGSGFLGPGWSISGLSAISRCGRSYALDGERGGISWAQSDRYCIDGQRLILVSGRV